MLAGQTRKSTRLLRLLQRQVVKSDIIEVPCLKVIGFCNNHILYNSFGVHPTRRAWTDVSTILKSHQHTPSWNLTHHAITLSSMPKPVGHETTRLNLSEC